MEKRIYSDVCYNVAYLGKNLPVMLDESEWELIEEAVEIGEEAELYADMYEKNGTIVYIVYNEDKDNYHVCSDDGKINTENFLNDMKLNKRIFDKKRLKQLM